MSGTFNGYHVWLGIPPNEQPPNHYRLLGITQFETDVDVIDHAADRQMAHVRTFQSGRHATLSQQILNELSAARLCLLNSEKKAAYDEQLRAKLATATRVAPVPVGKALPVAQAVSGSKSGVIPSAVPVALAGAAALPVEPRRPTSTAADPIALDFDPMADTSAPHVRLRTRRRTYRRNRWQSQILLAAVAAVVLVAGITVYRLLPRIRAWVESELWPEAATSSPTTSGSTSSDAAAPAPPPAPTP